LFEELCGARLTFSYIAPGGVTADAPPGWLGRVAAFLDQFAPVIDDLHALLTSNAVFIRRTAGVGVLAAGAAVDFGCTGPVLRGSGVDWDLRRDGEPLCTGMYEGYTYEVIAPKDGKYPTDHPYPPVPPEAVVGDCWHRYFVRMLEVVQSVYLVRQGIEKYAQAPGPVNRPIEVKKKLPQGAAYLETEAPKGQMGFMIISNGTPVPWRVRIRSSSFCNLSVMPELCRGVLVADVPSIAGSLDLVLGEIDR
jgi:NADH-quinone oxidoreductase subunit D